ncbi:MAG TPA: NAD(P)/FAD-dependent oxidoreductase [Gemmatimonadales bacterium]|nr:NAD(P)/FAD-dependent oxidoreductase [Gemmatimonadales bacterium]
MAGAGPAGLSAALMLGRCRRRVLVCDTGEPRNRWSLAVHGFLTRDGTAPAMLLALAREELRRYDTVELRGARVIDAERVRDGFQVRCEDGCEVHARKLLLATGVVDEVPAIDGIEAFYGRSVHHCPYCDGWEWRDQPIASYGREEHGAALALGLSVWSRDVILCTDGPAALPARTRARLQRLGIRVREERMVRLEGRDGLLERIVFDGGAPEARRALFFATGQHQASDLPARLGCRFTEQGAVATGKCEATNVPGLYVCGDASKEAQFVVVAAAEGAEAAMAINKALLEEDLA